jgi:hypothetical protein
MSNPSDGNESPKEQIRNHLHRVAAIDFDQLCKDGVLERLGKKKYKVPSREHCDNLPETLKTLIVECELQPDGSCILSFAKIPESLRRKLGRK